MRMIVDNDLHIHSGISLCSGRKDQTPANILKYAEDNGLSTICLTDHFWDESVKSDLNDFYRIQDSEHISAALPLPTSDKVRFLFGVETDLDKNCVVGVAPEHYDRYAFISSRPHIFI